MRHLCVRPFFNTVFSLTELAAAALVGAAGALVSAVVGAASLVDTHSSLSSWLLMAESHSLCPVSEAKLHVTPLSNGPSTVRHAIPAVSELKGSCSQLRPQLAHTSQPCSQLDRVASEHHSRPHSRYPKRARATSAHDFDRWHDK